MLKYLQLMMLWIVGNPLPDGHGLTTHPKINNQTQSDQRQTHSLVESC